MPATRLRSTEALTPKNMIASYAHMYRSIYGKQPDCYHMEARWFMVQGVRRDKEWLALEIERMRQQALVDAFVQNDSKPTSILRLIRRLSRL